MHATGLFNTIGALRLGGTVVLGNAGGLLPVEVWETMAREHVKTIIIAGNAVAHTLIRELAAAEQRGQPYDLSSMTTVLSSDTAFGDHLERDLHQRSKVIVIDAIGSSEGGPFVFGSPTMPATYRLAFYCVGHPSVRREQPGTECRVSKRGTAGLQWAFAAGLLHR
ncbi:AMP-binding protein [Gordonia terrae]